MSKYKTFDEIVDIILSEIDPASRSALLSMKKDDLIMFHHSTGRAIRNDFGLWDKENPITAQWKEELDERGVDMSPFHPDATSMRVIETVWEKVHAANLPDHHNC